MYKHRIAFAGAWLVLAIGLLKYPGFEGRGLFLGMIIGAWPFLLFGPAAYAINEVVVIGTLFLSGGAVGLCGWSADAARLSKLTWALLLVAIVAGGGVSYGLNDYSFEDWNNSPAISAAVEAGALNYEPTRRDYHEGITIPKALAGAAWGLYVAAALTFFYAIIARGSSTSHGPETSPPHAAEIDL